MGRYHPPFNSYFVNPPCSHAHRWHDSGRTAFAAPSSQAPTRLRKRASKSPILPRRARARRISCARCANACPASTGSDSDGFSWPCRFSLRGDRRSGQRVIRSRGMLTGKATGAGFAMIPTRAWRSVNSSFCRMAPPQFAVYLHPESHGILNRCLAPSAPPAPRHGRAEARRTARDPFNEPRKTRMGAQGIDCVELKRQFLFRQGGVDFAVTDMVQQDQRPTLAPTGPGHKVMQALWHPRRDRAQAQGANRVRRG